jgi:hypothetical protein
MRDSTEAERIYAAGFFDGEGCVLLIHDKSRFRRHHRGGSYISSERYDPRLEVTNTNMPVLQWFLGIWGGQIKPRRTDGEHRQPIWYWKVNDYPGIARVLRELLPYLRVKEPQSRVLADWMALPREQRQREGAATAAVLRLLKRVRGDEALPSPPRIAQELELFG